VQSVAGKMTCRRTALKRFVSVEMLWALAALLAVRCGHCWTLLNHQQFYMEIMGSTCRPCRPYGYVKLFKVPVCALTVSGQDVSWICFEISFSFWQTRVHTCVLWQYLTTLLVVLVVTGTVYCCWTVNYQWLVHVCVSVCLSVVLRVLFCVSEVWCIASVFAAPLSPPRSVRITDVRATNMSLSWLPPDETGVDSNILGYKASSCCIQVMSSQLLFFQFVNQVYSIYILGLGRLCENPIVR